MKNYKLDVVRYNNEDVIATSGPACERTETIYKYIEKDPSHYFDDLTPHNQDADKFMVWYYNESAGIYEYQYTDFEPCDDSIEYGHYYHDVQVSPTDWELVECTNPASHNLPGEN